MIDFNSLPLLSKIILIIGFALGITSLIISLRYPIMLILMKYSPKYREFIKKTLVTQKQDKINSYRKYGRYGRKFKEK